MNLNASLRKPLKIREYRRVMQNLLVSSFMNYAVKKTMQAVLYMADVTSVRYNSAVKLVPRT